MQIQRSYSNNYDSNKMCNDNDNLIKFFQQWKAANRMNRSSEILLLKVERWASCSFWGECI